MSKIHLLRMFLNDRLAAVVEEICGQVERTIAEYQDEVCRSKEEICQLPIRRVMNKVPEIRLHRSDIQQLTVPEEQVSAAQPHWSGPDPDQHLPERPMIKEEHDELWISHEDDLLPGLEALVDSGHNNREEAGVEADRDIDAPSSSSTTEHMKTEPGGEEPGREVYDETETACDSGPLCAVKPGLVAAPMGAGSTMLKSQKQPTEKRESSRITLKETHLNPSHVVCKLCGQAFGYNSSSEHWKHVLLKHSKDGKSVRGMWRECFEATILPKQLPNNRGGRFCTVCGKCFSSVTALRTHSRIHTGEKPFLCTHCGKRFNQLGNLVGHMRIHTGEKPYPCDVCGKRFRVSNDMQKHMRRMHMRRESIVSIHDNQWPSVAKPAS